MFVYNLSGYGFESCCSHLNFRICACFEQGVPWHSGNYRVWIHSETCTWDDKNIQPNNNNAVIDAQRTIFQAIFYFGRYRDDCITIWARDVGKIDLLPKYLHSLDKNLKFAAEIGGKS